ncbi:MAG: methyltransferase domain-containing protein [bacterium]
MRREFLDLICCPACGAALELRSPGERDGEVWEGTLACAACAVEYEIRQGMPHLYVDDEAWAPKAREAQGWVELHKNMGIYEQGEDAVDLKIPYYPEEPWTRVSHSFDIALERLNLTGEETILDLGAGRGWAAKHFALNGCRAVALDITPDEQVGLGRGRALMEDAGVYFERVIGDGERLPFQPESFDIVFCAASLHHSSNLPLLLQNASDVLKEGGRLCAINEPSISVLEQEEHVLAQSASPELELGINEKRPNFLEYRQALVENDLQISEAFPVPAYEMDEQTVREWAQDLGVLFPRLTLHDPRRTVYRLMRFVARRGQALLRRRWPSTNGAAPRDERQRLLYNVLLWTGNELFLVAEKRTRNPNHSSR